MLMFMTIEALQKAIDIAGTQTALGNLIGKDQRAVWSWLNLTKKVPAESVLKIEQAVNGEVTRHDLRPDLYPAPNN